MRRLHCAVTALGLCTLSACGSSPDTSTSEKATAVAQPTTNIYAIGESVSTDSYEFTLKSIEEGSKAADSPFAEPTGSGEVFVVAKFTTKNLGSKPVDTIELPKVELLDARGTVYSEDIINSAFTTDNGGTEALGDVNPGVTYRSGLAWKVAKGAFDPATWKIVVRSDPAFEYRLK